MADQQTSAPEIQSFLKSKIFPIKLLAMKIRNTGNSQIDSISWPQAQVDKQSLS